MDTPQLLTTIETGKLLGVNRQRVWGMIETRRLKTIRVGLDWLIPAEAVEAVRHRPPGRPKRQQLPA